MVPATAAPMIVGLFQHVDEGRATAMAESNSMTIEQIVREVMDDEHADVLRESVRLVVQELMNAEVSELIGAELGERAASARAGLEELRHSSRPRRSGRGRAASETLARRATSGPFVTLTGAGAWVCTRLTPGIHTLSGRG